MTTYRIHVVRYETSPEASKGGWVFDGHGGPAADAAEVLNIALEQVAKLGRVLQIVELPNRELQGRPHFGILVEEAPT